ncbi:MAG: ion transporter [Verrucomicrobia bacterium]|jgi:voltage-gated sodium channel|nr:ion transporter [Verrucomicrobiota bacterium]
MSDSELSRLRKAPGITPGRLALAERIESLPVQIIVTSVIILNAIILGLDTSEEAHKVMGPSIGWIDSLCLALFVGELIVKLAVYRSQFWLSGWNLFDTLVIGIALMPGAGPWAVLRSLRVLRVLRLFTVVPQMRQVVAAFLHAIPGLSSVMAVMGIFFYTAAVLATNLFGSVHSEWFGSIGKSLYTLFQIMTLESWSMGIVRPVMESKPWAWAFFVPFIIIATFTILNLFIGIIVSTMQELASMPDPKAPAKDLSRVLLRMESDLKELKRHLKPPSED